MANVWAIAKRELQSYFGTPIAYVFLAIFVALTGVFAFYIGAFFDRGEADLRPFFEYHPWLYLLMVPAISMRLWAEERASGTIELLMDAAGIGVRGGHRQVPGRMGLSRHRADPHVSDVDHRQRAGRAG